MYKILPSLIVFILAINVLIADAAIKNNVTDSINNQRFNNLQVKNERLKHILDSLGMQLSLYTEDAKHYDTNLSQQTAIFVAIVVIIAGLIGFFSYDKIKLEISKSKDELDKRTEKVELQLGDAEIRLFAVTSNTYLTISDLEKKEGHIGASFSFLFSSCFNAFNLVVKKKELYKIKKEIKYNSEKTLSSLKASLKDAEDIFNVIKNQKAANFLSEQEKNVIMRDKEAILNVIDEMLKSDLSEIKDSLSKLRVDINSFN